MLATPYDVQDESLVATTGELSGHAFKHSVKSKYPIHGLYASSLVVHCECGWSKVCLVYEPGPEHDRHVSEVTAGC